MIFVPKATRKKDRRKPRNNYREVLTGFAPGHEADSWLGTDYGKLLPAGADIVLQLHYTANGTAGFDRSRIGLRFRDGPPAKRIVTVSATNNKFVIPPGAPAHPVESRWVLNRDVELIALLPHMHLRGKDFRYDLRFPDGRIETLLSVPRYDFDWQFYYYLKDPMALPAGTAIECLAPLRQLAQQPGQSGPERGSSLGRPELGGDDDRVLRDRLRRQRRGSALRHPAEGAGQRRQRRLIAAAPEARRSRIGTCRRA